MSWISEDGKVILLSRGIRSFGYGFLSVLLGIYLKDLGFSVTTIGLFLSTTIIGGALFTLFTGRHAAQYGLKRVLILTLVLSLIGASIFVWAKSLVLLLIAAFIGFISPSGRELGPFLSLEQAYLSFTVPDNHRTNAFTLWNLVATLSSSIGVLLSSLPKFLTEYFGIERIVSFKLVFAFFLLLNVIIVLLYTRLSEIKFVEKKSQWTAKGKKVITKLSFLFAIDSFAGGFVITSVVSLWFYSKFHTPLSVISSIFFAAGLLEALSFYISGILAKRTGLVNTIVFTHIPSSIFLILVPFAPSFYLAVALYLLRQLLSAMDIPARQSYVVAIVNPEERASAAAITNVARIVASSFGPSLASRILLGTALSPFVVSGMLKIIYDLCLYVNFRRLKPPEEQNTVPMSSSEPRGLN